MSKILSAFLNSILLNHVGNPSRLDPRARILLPSALPCLANKNRAKRERPALASSSRNRWITPIHGFNVRHSSTDFSSDYSKTGGERRLILRGEGEGVSMTRSIECVGLKWIIAKSKRYFEGFRGIRSFERLFFRGKDLSEIPRRGDPEFEDEGSSQEFVREMSISRGA